MHGMRTTESIEQRDEGAPQTLPDDAKWRAVEARDPAMDGRFVYAVSSTGIYCRPSCSSRRPRRDRVRFFSTPSEADREGYRPCKRCRPGERVGLHAAVERARALIDANPEGRHTLADLAREAAASPFHLQRLFREQIGSTPKQYLAIRRAERLKQRLREGDTVSRATYEAGYGSSSRVYEQSTVHLGMTPATYRRGGEGMTISWAIVNSPHGRLLVGATVRGVCAVAIGDRDAPLVEALRHEYPNATLRESSGTIGEWTRAIVRHLEGRSRTLDVPIDVEGTDFQWKVWRALSNIPYGTTRSYAEIAAQIGAPAAARAVARACATNRVAIVIPCHRVVRGDGTLGGYRWGLERKAALLDQERAGGK